MIFPPLHIRPFLLAASVVCAGVLRAAVIPLDVPVGSTLTPDGIYWTYNDQSGPLIADESGNGYNGTMIQGYNNPNWVNQPTLAAGVNVPGASDYGNGMSVVGKSQVYAGNQNPSARYEPSSPSAYAMAGVDFTGGTWLMADPSTVVPVGYINMYLMTSGNSWVGDGHWTVSLYTEDVGETWFVIFQAGDGLAWSSGSLEVSNLLDGDWHHVGFNFNAGTNAAQFWIDGTQLAGSVQLTNGVGLPGDYEDRTFRVGERVGGNGYSEMSFTGMFDDTFVTTGLHSFAAIPEPSVSVLLAVAGCLAGWCFRRQRSNRLS